MGYFTISSVGFNNEFYFPHIINLGTGKTISEYIFSLDVDYYLEEKIHFLTLVQKYMTSNYISFYNENMEESIGKESMNILNEVKCLKGTKAHVIELFVGFAFNKFIKHK